MAIAIVTLKNVSAGGTSMDFNYQAVLDDGQQINSGMSVPIAANSTPSSINNYIKDQIIATAVSLSASLTRNSIIILGGGV